MPADKSGLTDDAALGGKIRLLQPKRGHRFGHDAILLAAAIEAKPGQRIVELGAGVGAASLAVLMRVPKLEAFLIEIEPPLCELAAKNIKRNGFDRNARAVLLDVTANARSFAAAGLQSATFDHVMMNPPFNEPSRPSPDTLRRKAHAGSEMLLTEWVGTAVRLLRPSGILTLIWRADGLSSVLPALADQFGAIAVLPIHPAPQQPAVRVIVRGIKGSRAPLALVPSLTLNDENHRPTAEAEAVLRAGAALHLSEKISRSRDGLAIGATDGQQP